MKKIIVTIRVEEHHKERLRKAARDNELVFLSKDEITRDVVQSANVIIGAVKADLVRGSKNLELLQVSSAGVNEYIAEGVVPPQAQLCNATGAYGLAISEHMIGSLFMIQKKLHLYRDNQQRSEWLDMGNVKGIEGSTVLVLGMGDIGGDFARKMKALGAYIIGVRRVHADKPDYVDEIHLTDEINELLPRADVVAMSLPSTPQTVRILNRERIAKMKDGAVVLNVGRGNAIDTDALCDAVESGKLGGAALDVTDPEPLPPEHRMWKIENIVITPHVSGFFHLAATHDRIVEIAADNLERFLDGRKLRNMIDFEAGYAKRDI